MSKNTIAITCYQRPEFLWFTLESLAKNPELPNYILHFFPDFGSDPGTYEVIEMFKSEHPEVEVKVSIKDHRKHSQLASYNIMDSYRIAIEENPEAEYLIICEEDTPVSGDFLRFNKKAHDKYLKNYDRIFCVSHKRRQVTEEAGDPSLLLGDPQCTSPTCIRVDTVKKYMLPLYDMPYYFDNPPLFYSQNYPNSRIPHGHHIDHDGAIERIIEKHNLYAIKPDQARTAHVGFVGGHLNFNRYLGTKLRGSLQQKIVRLKELIKTGASALRNMACHIPEHEKESWRGVTCIDLIDYEWNDLFLDLDRNLCLSSPSFYDEENTFKDYILGENKNGR